MVHQCRCFHLFYLIKAGQKMCSHVQTVYGISLIPMIFCIFVIHGGHCVKIDDHKVKFLLCLGCEQVSGTSFSVDSTNSVIFFFGSTLSNVLQRLSTRRESEKIFLLLLGRHEGAGKNKLLSCTTLIFFRSGTFCVSYCVRARHSFCCTCREGQFETFIVLIRTQHRIAVNCQLQPEQSHNQPD